MKHRLMIAVFLLTASQGFATTWLVGGDDGDFLDIPEAIAAASDGDVILVRPGSSYSSFFLDKAVMVRASSTAVNVSHGFNIRDIPAGKKAGVSGFRIYFYGVQIEDCAGDVIIEDVERAFIETGLIDIRNCANVSIQGLQANTFSKEGTALRVTNSKVRVTDFDITGADSVGGTAIRVTDSELTLANGTATGGQGAYSCGTGGDGLAAVDSRVIILGNEQDKIQGGEGGLEFLTNDLCGEGGDGIANLRSDITVSRVSILGGSGVPDGDPLRGDPIVYDHRFPYLEKTGAFVPGGNMTLTLHVVDAGTAIMDFSLETGFFDLPQAIGPDLHVQPFGGWFYTLVVGPVAEDGSISLPLTVPDEAFIQGFPITFQGAVFNDQGDLFLANAITSVIGE